MSPISLLPQLIDSILLNVQNRVIIELDPKGNVSAAITSSTHDRKSRCNIFFKDSRVYLKHNSLGDDIPIVVVLKAMGLECDQEIVQLVGTEPELLDLFSGSLEEPYLLGIYSQDQVSEVITSHSTQFDFLHLSTYR